MEKIILLSGQVKGNNTLIRCLEKLFPECEIEVHSEDHKAVEIHRSVPDTSVKSLSEERDLEKLMSFL